MRRLALLLAAAALVAAGCGGGGSPNRSDDDDRGDAPPAETIERTTRVEVVEEQGEGGGFDSRRIYERASPGVVTIISVFEGEGGGGLFGGDDDEDEPQAGQGSGFVVNADGEIATNAHVVTSGEGKDIKEAREVYVKFADDNQVPAEILGFDPNADVALLRIKDRAGLTLRPLPLGRSTEVKVGDPVAAIGSPFGQEQSLSVGVVSATDRAIESLTGFATLGAVQTDAAINQGNSGGPLLDQSGAVIGINAQIRTQSGGSEGVGYAIPVDMVRRSITELERQGEVNYAYLGVTTTAVYPQLDDRFDLGTDHGAWVQEVVEDGPADDAGIEPGRGDERFQARPVATGGDVIVSIDGREVRTENDLGIIVALQPPGKKVKLEILRDGERRTVEVELDERPDQVDNG